jgi:hypothetical protein
MILRSNGNVTLAVTWSLCLRERFSDRCNSAPVTVWTTELRQANRVDLEQGPGFINNWQPAFTFSFTTRGALSLGNSFMHKWYART